MTNSRSPGNDSRRLSQLQDANTGPCHYQRPLHKWQFNPDRYWCNSNELLSHVMDSHITKPLSALIMDHHVWNSFRSIIACLAMSRLLMFPQPFVS